MGKDAERGNDRNRQFWAGRLMVKRVPDSNPATVVPLPVSRETREESPETLQGLHFRAILASRFFGRRARSNRRAALMNLMRLMRIGLKARRVSVSGRSS